MLYKLICVKNYWRIDILNKWRCIILANGRNTDINFPRDPDTLRIIKEIEIYLEFPHKNITMINECELHKYINKLTLVLIKVKNA